MLPNLVEIESLARQAGEILRKGYGQNHQITYKGEIDLVTEIDRQSETFLMEEISQRYPQHAIVAEESGGLSGDAGSKWYIDPLDGTVNFAHGIPIFSVSLAFTQNESILLGAVYDPLRDECFSAEAGKGAWLNGEPIHSSNVLELEKSLLVTGFPYDIRTNCQTNLDLFAEFSLASQGVRRLGSAALDLCYVAAGRFDGYWEMRLSPWDLAAGALIALEAGAKVSDLKGGQDYLQPPYSILAAAPGIHAQMLQRLDGRSVSG